MNTRSGEPVEVLRQYNPEDKRVGKDWTDERAFSENDVVFEIRFLSDNLLALATLDELPDEKQYRFGEIVFDITTCAVQIMQEIADARPLAQYDSRELYYCISQWSEEFMAAYPNPEDYLDKVDEFAYAKLREHFWLEEDLSWKRKLNAAQ